MEPVAVIVVVEPVAGIAALQLAVAAAALKRGTESSEVVPEQSVAVGPVARWVGFQGFALLLFRQQKAGNKT